MSDDGEEGTVSPAPAPKKKSSVGIIIGVLLAASVAGGAAFFVPKYLSGGHAAKPDAEGGEEAEEPASGDHGASGTVAFQPIVVDVRGQGEDVHHLKVVLTFELKADVKPDEFEKLTPRGREAAIVYLRSKSFEDVTSPEKFPELVSELTEKVVTALGKKRVKRMMITDFVTQ